MSSRFELGEAMREAFGDDFDTSGGSLADMERGLMQAYEDATEPMEKARLAEAFISCKKLRVQAVQIQHKEARDGGAGESEVTSLLRGLQEKKHLRVVKEGE